MSMLFASTYARYLRALPNRRREPQRTCCLFFLFCGVWSGSCDEPPDQDGGEDAPYAYEDCSGSCETNDWPRAIVALSGLGASDAELSASNVNGDPLMLIASGCPELPADLECSYSVATSDAYSLKVRHPGAKAESFEVELAPYNPCGRDIAYQEVRVEASAITFFPTRYVSPCNAAWKGH